MLLNGQIQKVFALSEHFNHLVVLALDPSMALIVHLQPFKLVQDCCLKLIKFVLELTSILLFDLVVIGLKHFQFLKDDLAIRNHLIRILVAVCLVNIALLVNFIREVLWDLRKTLVQILLRIFRPLVYLRDLLGLSFLLYMVLSSDFPIWEVVFRDEDILALLALMAA